MSAIYKKELTGYFTTLSGYLPMAFYLLFGGIFVTIYNLYGQTPSIEMSYYNMIVALLFVIPLLTMRSVAGERQQKTAVLLSALPITAADCVLGKFFAILTVLAIPTAIIFSYTAILSFYGTIQLISAALSTLALFLVIAAMAAIGLFLSSLTDTPLAAGTLTFAVFLLIYFLPTLVLMLPATAIGSLLLFSLLIVLFGLLLYKLTGSPNTGVIGALIPEAGLIALFLANRSLLEGAAASFFSFLSITERFGRFSLYGIFDLTAIIYFISLTILFLFFTVLSMEKKRGR